MYLLAYNIYRRIAALAFCALMFTRIPSSAQEIQYDTVVRNTLGPELWAIPVSGPLTISQDGSKLLVASLRDSTFYIVDVATGAYKPVRSAPHYSNRDGGPSQTRYSTDADLRTLWVYRIDFYLDRYRHTVIDLQSDSILNVYDDLPHGSYPIMSRRQDRYVISNTLYKMSTKEFVSNLPEVSNITSWFDDAHNKLYRTVAWGVDEIDPATGKIEQSWAINSNISYARRPPNSDWLYVYGDCVDELGGSCGYVNAINVVTQEQVLFKKHNGDHSIAPSVYRANGATSTIGYCSRNAAGLGFQPMWSFDAALRKTATIINPQFYFFGQLTPKFVAITPDFDRYMHAWSTSNRDSGYTRCNQIIPLTTSVDRGIDSASAASWLLTSREWLEIRLGDVESITGIDIHSVRGQLVKHLDRSECQARPLRISLATLSGGSYLCTVQTNTGRRTSSFTISA